MNSVREHAKKLTKKKKGLGDEFEIFLYYTQSIQSVDRISHSVCHDFQNENDKTIFCCCWFVRLFNVQFICIHIEMHNICIDLRPVVVMHSLQ